MNLIKKLPENKISEPFLNFLRGRSIRFKLLFYFLSLIIIPTLTLGVLGNIIYSNSIGEEANIHTTQMIDQVKVNTEFYIRNMEDIINYISQDPEVLEALKIKNGLEENRISIETNVRRILRAFTDIHPEIAGILFVNQNGFYISNEMYRISRSPLTSESWYRKSIDYPEKIQLFSKPIGRNITTRFNYGADDVVSIVKAIRDPISNEYMGAILIDMKLETIEKVIKGITLGKSGFLFIIDGNGDIVFAPVNPIVYNVKATWLEDKSSKSIIKRIKDNRYQIIYNDSEYTQWKTVGVFSLNETLGQVINIRNLTIIIWSLTILLAVIAALFFTSSIAKPLSKLKKLMKRAEIGDLDVRFESKYSDEIGQVGNSFNNMISEIKKLIQIVYSEQKSKREAELKILQAQIKPHFLYNTLGTIHWMSQEYKAYEIAKIVSALTNLFRISLSKGKEMIEIEEELEHVRSYMIIQKERYRDKMEYEINFEEDILHCQVLKVILQPMVENAIYHGIKEKRGIGRIIIDVEKKDDKILLRVTDNGAGVQVDKLQQIIAMLEKNVTQENAIGCGISNVNERIKLSFGTEFGIKINSIYGEYTIVEIWHPIIK